MSLPWPLRIALALMLGGLTACATGQPQEIGPAVKGIETPKVVRVAPPPERKDFHLIERRRWVPEEGYYLTTYRKNQLTPQERRPDLLMAPDGRHFIIFEAKTTRFISTETGEEVFRLNVPFHTASDGFFSRDFRYFIFSSPDFDLELAKSVFVDSGNYPKDRRPISTMFLINMQDDFRIERIYYEKDICSKLHYDPNDCAMIIEDNGPINSSNQSLGDNELLIREIPSKNNPRYEGGWPYYAYNFRTKEVKTLPRFSIKEMMEFVFKSGLVKPEEYSAGISETVRLVVSEELLRKDIVVYFVRVPFKPVSEKNSSYAPKLFHGLISINVKTGERKIIGVPGYEDTGGASIRTYVRGDKIALLGGTLFQGRYTMADLYQVFQVTPEWQRLFSYSNADKSKVPLVLGYLYAVRDRDHYLGFRSAKTLTFTDVYLNPLRSFTVPFRLGGLSSEQSISVDGRTAVGTDSDSKNIYLIQFP